PRCPRVGRASADTLGSIRVLTKCGFRLTARERGFAHARGAEIDEGVLVLDAAPAAGGAPTPAARARRRAVWGVGGRRGGARGGGGGGGSATGTRRSPATGRARRGGRGRSACRC